MTTHANDRPRPQDLALASPTARAAIAAEPWLLSLDASMSSAEGRGAIAAGLVNADVARFGWLVLHTCRRVELLGAGPRPEPVMIASLTGTPDAASLTVHIGDAVLRRLARLAAGLESSVVGEDQVLGQVRRLRASAAGQVIHPRVVDALDTAIAVGRRARAERPRTERSLAQRGLAWLDARHDLPGARLLVVGAGPIGADAVRRAQRAGAAVTVASRRAERLRGGAAAARLTLREAAAIILDVELVFVALAGPWLELLDHRLAPTDRLPFVVDVSAPASVPGPVRAILGRRLATLDDLQAAAGGEDPVSEAYRVHAEDIVEEAVGARSQAARSRASETIAAIRARAEAQRADALERLLRRLPELSDRQRSLVEQHGRQLIADVLHLPTVRLREGPDDRRLAAARDLFGL